MDVKQCNTCECVKSVDEFYPEKRGLFGRRGECAACNKAKKYGYREANKDRLTEMKRAQYIKHRDKVLAQKKQYRRDNHGAIIALATARKGKVRLRTPKWLSADDKWLIKEAYRLASLRTEMTGIEWHVDHIIPLQGKDVSGLHSIENLQVIPWIDNIRKRNRYEADNAK